jgi:hypothetical protein
MNWWDIRPPNVDTQAVTPAEPQVDLRGLIRLFVHTANDWHSGSNHLFMKCRTTPVSVGYVGDYCWVRQLTGHSTDAEVWCTRTQMPVGERDGRLVFMVEAIVQPQCVTVVDAIAGGKYSGSLWKPGPVASTGAYAGDEGGSNGSSVIIINDAEYETADTDLANADLYSKVFPAKYVGPASDNGVPVYLINGLYWKNC